MPVSFKTLWNNAVVLIHSHTNIMLLNCGEEEAVLFSFLLCDLQREGVSDFCWFCLHVMHIPC